MNSKFMQISTILCQIYKLLHGHRVMISSSIINALYNYNNRYNEIKED
jgi:hypothetical protein